MLPVIVPHGRYIKVSVSDNGIGIKQEDIPKIFDKFSQIETSLKRNNGGVGLGLTITKQLIDSHLGAIEVTSQEQVGSVFSVYLPLATEPKIFEMDLSRALANNEEVGVFRICAAKELNLIEQLKENNLLNLSKQSKEICLDNGEVIDYYAFIPKISLSSFEAFFTTLNDFSQKIKSQEHAIILTKVHSLKDGTDVSNMIKILIGD